MKCSTVSVMVSSIVLWAQPILFNFSELTMKSFSTSVKLQSGTSGLMGKRKIRSHFLFLPTLILPSAGRTHLSGYLKLGYMFFNLLIKSFIFIEWEEHMYLPVASGFSQIRNSASMRSLTSTMSCILFITVSCSPVIQFMQVLRVPIRPRTLANLPMRGGVDDKQ